MFYFIHHLHRNLKDFKNEAFVHLYTAIEVVGVGVVVVVGLRYQQKCPEREEISIEKGLECYHEK